MILFRRSNLVLKPAPSLVDNDVGETDRPDKSSPANRRSSCCCFTGSVARYGDAENEDDDNDKHL
jgi:hypothetical protein